MKPYLLVFLGGGIGSMMRFGLSHWLRPYSKGFALGTFGANILGCLAIGFFLGWGIKSQNLNNDHTLLLITGFCGGFTTFSAFALENQILLKNGDYTHMLFYTLASVILGIMAVLLGLFLSKQL